MRFISPGMFALLGLLLVGIPAAEYVATHPVDAAVSLSVAVVVVWIFTVLVATIGFLVIVYRR